MKQFKKWNFIQKIITIAFIVIFCGTVMPINKIYATQAPTATQGTVVNVSEPISNYQAPTAPDPIVQAASNSAVRVEEGQSRRDEENPAEGSEGDDIGGVLFKPVCDLLLGIGDSINRVLQMVIIGDYNPVTYSTRFWQDDIVAKVAKRNPPISDGNGTPNHDLDAYIYANYIEDWAQSFIVAEIKLTPAEIFSGNVAALDANFFRTNASGELGASEGRSIVKDLKGVVSQWYVALRNIAIVGLLSVLLYIGIRTVISSSIADKSKYKQFFADWVIALCLIFFLHYIMAFTMTLSETVTDMIVGDENDKVIKQLNLRLVDGDEPKNQIDLEDPNREIHKCDTTEMYFSSNYTGLARLKSQLKGTTLRLGYTTIYLALTFYTVYFTFIYLKRLIMLAFLTMIAPLVALTYPLDKMKDSRAQAFDFWLKEYLFYSLLQPLHMLLYTVFVTSALNLASKNLLYSIVALAFIVPAEKIVKQMFGIKGQTESSIKGFAGGAIASKVFDSIKRKPPIGGKDGGKGLGGAKAKRPLRTSANSINAMNTLADMAGGNSAEAGMLGAGAAVAALHDEGIPERETTDPMIASGGPSAADAQYNNRNDEDPERRARRERLEEAIAEGLMDENSLTKDERDLLGIPSPQRNLQNPNNRGSNGGNSVPGSQYNNRNNEDPEAKARREKLEEDLAKGLKDESNLTDEEKRLLGRDRGFAAQGQPLNPNNNNQNNRIRMQMEDLPYGDNIEDNSALPHNSENDNGQYRGVDPIRMDPNLQFDNGADVQPILSPSENIENQLNPNTEKFKGFAQEKYDNLKQAVGTRYKAAGGAKGIAKSVAKAGAKGYVKAAGTVAMGTAGLAMGIVGGEMNDTWQGLAAGATAGAVVSNRANKTIERAVSGNTAIGRFSGEVIHGKEDYNRKQYIRSYVNDRENVEKLLDQNPKISSRDIQKQLHGEAELMYDSGIDDQKVIRRMYKEEKAMKEKLPPINKKLTGQEKKEAEAKREDQIQNIHNQTIALGKQSMTYDKNVFTDEEKFNSAKTRFSKQLQSRGVQKKAADENAGKMMETMGRIRGIN